MAYMENLAIVDADTSATIYTQPFSHARCPRSTKGGHPLGNSSLYLKRKKKKAMKIIIDYSRHVHLGCSYGLSSFFLYFCSVIVSHEDSLSPSQLFMCLDFCITTWEKGGYLVGVLGKGAGLLGLRSYSKDAWGGEVTCWRSRCNRKRVYDAASLARRGRKGR